MMQRAEVLPERPRYLVLLAIPPVIWMTHFLLTYVTAAVWCARFAGYGGSLGRAHVAIAIYSVVALAGLGATAWSGFTRHRYGTETPPHDSDTPEDRHRFLGLATMLLAGLSGIATIFVWLSTGFFTRCV
jgi:hypothetical protein